MLRWLLEKCWVWIKPFSYLKQLSRKLFSKRTLWRCNNPDGLVTLQWFHHHHQVVLLAWISLTLSHHLSLSSIDSGWSSCIGTELLYIGSNWSSYLCSSMWRGLQEYIAYEFVHTSLAVSRMSGSSNHDSFHDGWLVAVQLLFWGCCLN